MLKRGLDVTLSALLLLGAAPVLLLAIVLIRLGSPGPAIFRQRRMGRGFQSFELFKLRTMAHAEAGLAYTLGADPRITPFGRWLRRTKLDEVPQLWNVLRGDMSLVGPRPVLPELTAEFEVDYRLLLRARPGLTDPASLKYSQEAALLGTAADPMKFFKSVITPDKLRLSLACMDRATVWSDLTILWMTACICCVPRLSRVYGDPPQPAVPAETGVILTLPHWEQSETLAVAAPAVPYAPAHAAALPATIIPRWARVLAADARSLSTAKISLMASHGDAAQELGHRPTAEDGANHRAAFDSVPWFDPAADPLAATVDCQGPSAELPWNPHSNGGTAQRSAAGKASNRASRL